VLAQRRRTPIYALMSANTVSRVGNQLAVLALPWFVLQTTGSAVRVGLAGAVESLAIILSALLGGVLVDRIGFRRSSIVADCGSGLVIALIPLLDRMASLAFWELLLLIFLANVLNTPGSTARQSILPDLAEVGGITLERISAINEAVGNVAGLAGPLMAGFLIAAIAARNVLWIDAATFAFSAAAVLAFVPATDRATEATRRHYLTELAEGVRFLFIDRVLFSLALLGAYINMVGSALMAVVLPVLAKRVFGSSIDLGLLIAADGGGALFGALFYGARGGRWPRRATLTVTLLVSFAGLAALVPLPGLIVSVAALVVDGAAFGVLGPLVYTIYQERIPVDLRGRVFGALGSAHRLAAPAGVFLAGYLIQFFSLRSALGTVALLSLVMPLMVLATPALRSLGPPTREPLVAADAGEHLTGGG